MIVLTIRFMNADVNKIPCSCNMLFTEDSAIFEAIC